MAFGFDGFGLDFVISVGAGLLGGGCGPVALVVVFWTLVFGCFLGFGFRCCWYAIHFLGFGLFVCLRCSFGVFVGVVCDYCIATGAVGFVTMIRCFGAVLLSGFGRLVGSFWVLGVVT